MLGLRFNLIVAVLVMMLVFLQYCLWFQENGIGDLIHLKKVMALQAERNEELKKTNEEVLFQVERLQKSHDAAESRARNELGMIKKGEKFYQIIKDEQ
jgi:cell division protein FtsB